MLNARKAKTIEFDAVMAFYNRMIDEMVGTEFDVQWKHGEHPTPEYVQEALEENGVYICEATDDDAEIAEIRTPGQPVVAAALIVNSDKAPGFDDVPWPSEAAEENSRVVHLVATLPEYHGRGIAYKLMQYAIESEREAGVKALRLDTFQHNLRAQKLYEKCGFVDLGPHPVFYEYLGEIEPKMYEIVL